MFCLNRCSKVSLQTHFETDTIPERDCIYFNTEQKQTQKSMLPFFHLIDTHTSTAIFTGHRSQNLLTAGG